MPRVEESSAAFHGVFTAKTRDELETAYDQWKGTYDDSIASDLAGDGENHPTTETLKTLKAALSLQEASRVKRVLDVGAGTGAAGPLLVDAFGPLEHLVAFDLSAGMLTLAERRGCYTKVVKGACPDMSAVRPASDEELYDLIFSAGTFTPNHAPATTLAQLVPLVRRGGHIAFSIRAYWYEDAQSGFKVAQAELEAKGAWRRVAMEERPYLPKQNVMALYFVYEVL